MKAIDEIKVATETVPCFVLEDNIVIIKAPDQGEVRKSYFFCGIFG